jgi:hypothetical protein
VKSVSAFYDDVTYVYPRAFFSGRTSGFQTKSSPIRIGGYFLFALARAVRDDRLEALGPILAADEDWERLGYDEKRGWNDRAQTFRATGLGAQHKRIEARYKSRRVGPPDLAKAARLASLRQAIRRRMGELCGDLLLRGKTEPEEKEDQRARPASDASAS